MEQTLLKNGVITSPRILRLTFPPNLRGLTSCLTEKSIKGGTRTKRKRGQNKGIRKNVDSREQRIGNWKRFIAIEDNKASLAHFLSTEISKRYSGSPRYELVISGGFNDIQRVWSSDLSRDDFLGLASTHEEADTRIVLHAKDAAHRGYRQVNVLCRDTDVLVLLLAHKEELCEDIWMFSGTSRRKQYIPVHKIQLPEEKKKSLLAFHAITGCDTTNQFAGIGKQSAWKAFEGCSLELLRHLGDEIPPNTSVLADAEAFVCQLYSKDTGKTSINKARSSAFRKAKNKLDTLPSTQDALRLHITRSNYQTLIWKKALEPCPLLPKPEEMDGTTWKGF